MSLLPYQKRPTFNFLTLGERGVGKTVFFAGCYAEINNGFLSQKKDQLSWFEGQNHQDKENLDNILNYVAKNGQYPPATLKITEFNLDLKQRNRQTTKTLCNFRWYDIPGEFCDVNVPAFKELVIKSHSCYVFLNAAHLINQPTYIESLEELLEQITVIATLKRATNKNYTFVLVFTQFDRLKNKETARFQVEEKIRPFLISLEKEDVKYIRFYSEVPIIQIDNFYKLNPKGIAVSLIWVVSDLQRNYRKIFTIFSIESYLAWAKQYRQWLIGIGTLALASVIGLGIYFTQKSPNIAKNPEPASQKEQYKLSAKGEPQDLEALVKLSESYLNQGEFGKAIDVIKTITEKQPNNLDWQLNLAKLYELTENNSQAEQVYDGILAKDNQHFYALLGKALIRQQNQDVQTARQLFKQAEEFAPSEDLKKQVRQFRLSQ
ncbi:MAG: tetratricopeptide repeat protein [Crocosphaera sp.]|nr:tetratricopeptide repeat protein [Crocosphaera sp.]